MNESSHMCKWVMVHVYMSHGTHMYASWHVYETIIAQVNLTSIHAPLSPFVYFIRMCAMIHSYIRHDSFICVPWLIDTWHRSIWHQFMLLWALSFISFVCVPWFIRIYAMTHSFVCHDSLIHGIGQFDVKSRSFEPFHALRMVIS